MNRAAAEAYTRRRVGRTGATRDSPGVSVVVRRRSVDRDFAKYAQKGAYHWAQVGRGLRAHHAFTAERYRRSVAALRLAPGLAVLDYGCGDGAMLPDLLAAVGPTGRVEGFDPTPDALSVAREALARRRLNVQLYTETAAVPTESFDRVVCCDVIEHVLDPKHLLQEIHRVLAPGGLAVLTTPVRLNEFPEDPNHHQEWFMEEFRELLMRSPLRVLHHEAAIPVAAVEVYSWRPRVLLGLPIFKLACNVASALFDRNALTGLGLPPRRFLLQLAVLIRE